MLSEREQQELKTLLREQKKWGLTEWQEASLKMLRAKQGSAAADMKQGKSKFLATADIDRQMGGVLMDALKPDGVTVDQVDLERGQTGMYSSYDSPRVQVSQKSRWEDLQVATRRTKNAPVLPVIEKMLPYEMRDVWIGLEAAHSAVKQAEWTHNDKIVSEQKRWLQRKDDTNLQGLIQRAALGIPVTDAMQTMRKASDIDWLVDHSLELQDAVKTADDMESLVEVAMWVGAELGLVDIDDDDDDPDEGGEVCDKGIPDNQDQDGDGDNKSDGDDDGDTGDDDSTDDDSDGDDGSGDKSEDSTDDKDSDSKDSGSDGDQQKGEQDKPSGSDDKSQDKPKSLKDKVKDAVAEAMDEQDNAPPTSDGLFDLTLLPDEKPAEVIDSDLIRKKPIVLHSATKAVEAEFEMLDAETDDYFGDPQGDILHDVRLGILDVFEQETESDPQLIIAVDASISMMCLCKPEPSRYRYNVPVEQCDGGYLAWQVAGILGKQYPESSIFAWTSRRRNPAAIVYDMPIGQRPLCRVHESTTVVEYMGNTPESDALLYAQSQLESNENSVLVIVTDGEPQNKSRSYGLTHAMYKAGTKFAVVCVGSYQPRQEEMHYPPATIMSIKSPSELSKVSQIFDLIRK